MMEVAPLRPGAGFSIRKFIGYYSLRLVPFLRGRRLVALMLTTLLNIRRRHGSRVGKTRRDSPDITSLAAVLREQGIALGPRVPRERIEDIRDFLREHALFSSDGRSFTEETIPKDVRLASYSLATVLRCPHILELMNDETSIALAEEYLGCRPTISAVRIDWSLPGSSQGEDEDVQKFHRDLDDWAFLKLFLYLTDVNYDSGPHVFVTGSHNTSERLRAEPYRPEEVDRMFGRECIKHVIGPAGTTFFEDTWGVHKGKVPTAHPRLVFQAQYSLLPIFKYNYRPIQLQTRAALDPYVNRLLIASPEQRASSMQPTDTTRPTALP